MEFPKEYTDKLVHVNKLEKQLGLNSGFFEDLLNENDWSFIIKLHALIEAASTSVLIDALNKPQIKSQLSRLPLCDSVYGKLSLLKSLNLIEKPYDSFVRKFSELRNDVVHNISQVSLDLEGYIKSLPKEKQRSLANAYGAGIKDIGTNEKMKYLLEGPKFLIWSTGLSLIAQLVLHKELFSNEQELLALGQKSLDLVSELASLTRQSSATP